MLTQEQEEVYVKVKDMAGNDFVCPLNELQDARTLADEDLENCFEGDVIGRYAGQLKVVDEAA